MFKVQYLFDDATWQTIATVETFKEAMLFTRVAIKESRLKRAHIVDSKGKEVFLVCE